MKSRRELYDEYLRSETWQLKRRERLSIDGKRCLGCGATRNLHVHHRTYERFGGQELMSDLVSVCEKCHALIHKAANKSRMSLDRTTALILRLEPAEKKPKPRKKPRQPPPRVPSAELKKARRVARKWRKAHGWERDSDPTWIKSVNPHMFKLPEEVKKRRDGLT